MIRERVTDEILDHKKPEMMVNVGEFSDRTSVQNKLMGRYYSDESILKLPEEPELTLGQALQLELAKIR